MIISFDSKKFIRPTQSAINMSSTYGGSEASPHTIYNWREYVSPSSQAYSSIATAQDIIAKRSCWLGILEMDYHGIVMSGLLMLLLNKPRLTHIT